MAEQVKKNSTKLEKELEKKDKQITKQSKEIENLKKENDIKNKKIDSFETTLKELQSQMLLFSQSKFSLNNKEEDSGTVKIGSRLFNTTPLCNLDESILILFECGEEKDVYIEDFKEIIKPTSKKNNRKLFENGLFYFCNEEDYDKYKIRKKVDLSNEKIKEIIFTKDINEMIGKVNKITNNLTNRNIVHCFKYSIVRMLLDKTSLKDWSYSNRNELEKYLQTKFDDLILNSNVIYWLKQNRQV